MAGMPDILSEYCIIDTNGVHREDANADSDRLLSAKFPAYDVPENIVVCVDVSSEMERNDFRTKSGERHSALSLVKKALGNFLSTKFKFRHDHNIAVCSIAEEANTSEAQFMEERRLGSLLAQVAALDAAHAQDRCDLTSLLGWLRGQLPVRPAVDGLPPEFTLRLVLVYGRSHSLPLVREPETLKALMDNPFFFLDVFYLHEQPDASNKCEAIFDFFCSLDRRNSSYVMEVTRSPTKLFDQMAQLLAHPLQRPPQSVTNYRLE